MSALEHDDRLPAITPDGGDGVQQGAVDALEALLPGGPGAAATAEGGGQHGQDGEEDELAVAAGAEMAAHPRQLPHAQGALRRAAQVRRQAAVALQDGSGLRRWSTPGPGWRRSEYIQIAFLSCNRSFQFGVLLLQETYLLLKYLLKPARKAVSYQLRAF